MGTRVWLGAVLAMAVACSGEGSGAGTGAGSGPGTRTGTDADTATSTGTGTGADADADADTGADADTDAGAGAGTGADTGADADTGTDAGTGAGTDADAGTGTGAGTDPDDGGGAGCSGGPLATPLPGCSLAPPSSTGDVHADCVARINQFRWECQCLPPLERWVDGEQCADGNAEYDSTNGVHASFFDFPCGTGARAQNECPGWPSNDHVVNGCLQAMWDEGPEDGNPNTVNGHYESMATTTYTRVACGFFTTPTGQVWGVQNFD